jgi:hypothetical protein
MSEKDAKQNKTIEITGRFADTITRDEKVKHASKPERKSS